MVIQTRQQNELGFVFLVSDNILFNCKYFYRSLVSFKPVKNQCLAVLNILSHSSASLGQRFDDNASAN